MTKSINTLQIKALPKGEHGIERGLRFKSRGDGTGAWQVRYQYAGKGNAMSIGDFPGMTLVQAREKGAQVRSDARAGIDPRAKVEAAQEAAKSSVRTFESVVNEALPIFKKEWKCKGTRNGVIPKLETYILPAIGKKPLADICAGDLVSMVAPMWHLKHSTADKCLIHVSKFLGWAAAAGYTCDRMAVKDARKVLGKTSHVSKPQSAFKWQDAPAHFQSLTHAMSDLAEGFLMLTGVRCANVQWARWEEINTESWTWVVPRKPTAKEEAEAEAKGAWLKTLGTTKNGEVHEVPLPRQAVAILGKAARFYDQREGYIFKSDTAHKTGVVSANNWAKKLREAGIEATAHGHRSAFKTWAEEAGIEDSKIVEEMVMHRVRKAQEAPYLRSQLTRRRRAALQKWADLLDGTTPVSFYDDESGADIINFDSVFNAA